MQCGGHRENTIDQTRLSIDLQRPLGPGAQSSEGRVDGEAYKQEASGIPRWDHSCSR